MVDCGYRKVGRAYRIVCTNRTAELKAEPTVTGQSEERVLQSNHLKCSHEVRFR